MEQKLEKLGKGLVELYLKHKAQIPVNQALPDNVLAENDNIKKCYAIAILLQMIEKEPEVTNVVAELDGYDAEKFADRATVKFRRDENGNLTYDFHFRDDSATGGT